LKGLFWRKRKGFIHEGQKNFFIKSLKLLTNEFINMNQKGFANIVLVLVVVVLVGVAGYFVFSRMSAPSPTPQTSVNTMPTQPTNAVTQPTSPTTNKKPTPSASKGAGGPGAIVNYHIANVPLKQGFYD